MGEWSKKQRAMFVAVVMALMAATAAAMSRAAEHFLDGKVLPGFLSLSLGILALTAASGLTFHRLGFIEGRQAAGVPLAQWLAGRREQ